ncbi:YndJ family protein [Bacillus swezeyi]|uniref:YndJ family transporter n=1 Tax=Bacillus swezeyi TaxID=1925020 RepID=A0A1R1QQ29_9BACI|nr:YndJ family protein [Bacillus swezeyi]MEC1261915.1 YndJ family protein [Bacillus swezeyi]MED2930304.1 YndJ family protein [Bacillus swezeyi]MED2966215.1 YndJ family protein [Bacillus swezeyi]MED3072751.1 YndJ family protein [Bacillus swezeyi]MED3080401.1 YndJ family protein [Bacillus swezeyi]
MTRFHWLVSALCYAVFILAKAPDIPPAEALLLLSALFFIPIAIRLIRHENGLSQLIIRMFPIAACSALFSLIFHSPFFSLIWLCYTGMIALFGALRIWERGGRRLEEVSIDCGLLYLPFGGFWLFAYTLNLEVMNFGLLIVLLTAVHFHYSAVFLPIFNGMLGRKLKRKNRLYKTITWIIMMSPLLIAIGISFSKIIDLIAVSLYLAAIYCGGFLLWRTSFKNKIARRFVIFSSLMLMLTIACSLIYSYGVFRGRPTFTIQEMIWIHGLVNAIAVIIPALIGWHLERPEPAREKHNGKRLSRIFGTWRIGADFLNRQRLKSRASYQGLADDMGIFRTSEFRPEMLPPMMIDFYENTANYVLKAEIAWRPWFKPFAFIYQMFSARIGQIHLGMKSGWQAMNGSIIGVDSDKDGRENVRAWVRTNEEGETIFVALYSVHTHEKTTYMNIALPLPFSHMTGILKPKAEDGCLILTSREPQSARGDEGIFLSTRAGTFKLPLAERFKIKAAGQDRLFAFHRMWLFGIRFLDIQYDIEKKDSAS